MTAPHAAAPQDVDFIDVHEHLVLGIDAVRAGAALDRYVAAHPPDGDGTGHLHLKAPVRLPNLGTEIELRSDVVVALHPGRSKPDGATSSANVTWSGCSDGPFPRLHGHLWVASAAPHTAWLRFDGRYRRMPSTVRLAAPGESVVGHRIVLATARLLLREVAAAIES